MNYPDTLVRGMVPRIRQHTKKSWIRKPDFPPPPSIYVLLLDPDSEIRDPGSGMEIIRIRDKHPRIRDAGHQRVLVKLLLNFSLIDADICPKK
jgi:hypothetical protein